MPSSRRIAEVQEEGNPLPHVAQLQDGAIHLGCAEGDGYRHAASIPVAETEDLTATDWEARLLAECATEPPTTTTTSTAKASTSRIPPECATLYEAAIHAFNDYLTAHADYYGEHTTENEGKPSQQADWPEGMKAAWDDYEAARQAEAACFNEYG